jgi:hypothetical protein
MYSELEVMSSEERIMNDNDNNKEIDGVLHYENYIVKYSDLVDAESNLDWRGKEYLHLRLASETVSNRCKKSPYEYENGEVIDDDEQFIVCIPVGYFDRPDYSKEDYTEWRHGVRGQLQQRKESNYFYPDFGAGPEDSLKLRAKYCPDVPVDIQRYNGNFSMNVIPCGANEVPPKLLKTMGYYSLTHKGLEKPSVARAALESA